MKRHGNLWKRVTNIETLRNAHLLAKRGKGHYSAVKEVEKDVEGHLKELRQALCDVMQNDYGVKM